MSERGDIRTSLAMLFTQGVTSAQAVYKYQKMKLQGESPVLMLMGAGDEPSPFVKSVDTSYFVELGVFVLHGDPNDTGYNEDDAEDALDAVKGEINAVLRNEDNRRSLKWEEFRQEGRSTISRMTLEGEAYLMEIVPLKVRWF